MTCRYHARKCRALLFVSVFLLFFFFKGKRDRLYFLLGPDILTSKCYVVRKIMFQKNLEKVDVPLFGNSHDIVSNA